MRESTARMLPHAQRLLLLALGLGLLWTAAAFFLHIPAAGAAEDDDGGLLGTATSVVEGATGAVDEARLWRRMMDMAQFGATPAGVSVSSLSLSHC